MASTRSQQGALITAATSNGFLAQAVGSVLAYAVGVLTEGAGVNDHVNRLGFARAVINAPVSTTVWLLPGYLQNANIVAACGTPASIADADVDAQTATIWNVFANAYAAQLQAGTPLQFGS
jgi:hypothetical protein